MDKMTFVEACGLVYSKGLAVDHKREIEEPSYMPHEAFGGICKLRAKAMSYNAEKRVDNFRGYVFALSKEVKDGESTGDQQVSLMAEMPEEDIFMAQEGVTVYGWWSA